MQLLVARHAPTGRYICAAMVVVKLASKMTRQLLPKFSCMTVVAGMVTQSGWHCDHLCRFHAREGHRGSLSPLVCENIRATCIMQRLVGWCCPFLAACTCMHEPLPLPRTGCWPRVVQHPVFCGVLQVMSLLFHAVGCIASASHVASHCPAPKRECQVVHS
jgi:hypothetical protein